ncbi:nucleotidyltransferase domain-containing protein [Brachybacterium sacelli]|uniref:Nucleotidyltransferase n=1 Tax=Brachybacterium sacelli TaxID=173364 RepID=A0ABS4WZQ2_9MICO|nr:putative nucleotidyltransferase [Brachybacterium sacelli]
MRGPVISDEQLLEIAERVGSVPGIRAVTLGGSRARGTHHPDSDVDLGLYYDADTLDLPALRQAASGILGAPVDVAGPGGWGPWVDGGAWLTVDATAVDLILRECARVREQRDRAIRGEFAVHQQTGHPLGFLDVAYAGEVATCRPLVDANGVVEELRAGLSPYPRALRDALVAHLVNAEFILGGAAKATGRGDLAYLQLCCTTALMWCAHAWHAEAGTWVTNEKGVVTGVARLPLDTQDFAARAADALARLGPDLSSAALTAAVSAVHDLVTATRASLA